jgi:hypothetical protein
MPQLASCNVTCHFSHARILQPIQVPGRVSLPTLRPGKYWATSLPFLDIWCHPRSATSDPPFGHDGPIQHLQHSRGQNSIRLAVQYSF